MIKITMKKNKKRGEVKGEAGKKTERNQSLDDHNSFL
jgi:hypothetical protein